MGWGGQQSAIGAAARPSSGSAAFFGVLRHLSTCFALRGIVEEQRDRRRKGAFSKRAKMASAQVTVDLSTEANVLTIGWHERLLLAMG
jgi:hypothetical protein